MTIDLKDRLYTSSEVAEILGVSLRSVYRYLEEGKLDADIKTATGRHRFSKKNILDFLKPSEPRTGEEESSSNKGMSLNDSDYDLEDLLDLPAISKASQDLNKNESDDFELDFDEEFFKNLEKINITEDKKDFNEDLNFNLNSSIESNSYEKVKNGDYQDDELEKLLREFEEKELVEEERNKSQALSNTTFVSNIQKQDSALDEEEDELSKLLKSLEMSLESEQKEKENIVEAKSNSKNTFDDFDFDFDLDFDNKNENNSANLNSSVSNDPKIESKSNIQEDEEDDGDNWLERFRKAAEKNSVKKEETKPENKDTLSNMFSDNNLDVFFNNLSNSSDKKETTSSISLNNSVEDEEFDGRYEYLYTSSLGGLKEIAQNVDQIAKKFDIDYAFTLNAGLSLHKPIAPFSLIHLYVREKDLELFEDYLQLNPAEDEATSSVCLITQESNEVFKDSYDLHGLKVVSNVQLRSDLIDKGLDKLAREI